MSKETFNAPANLDEIRETLSFLDSWEDRYKYIIDLGKALPKLKEEAYVPENLVKGCTSQVWLLKSTDSQTGRLSLNADSDAFIVKGLIALLLAVYDDKTVDEARAIPVEDIFSELGLNEHLSVNRRNGFFAMVERIKE
jgi:cysteine desulfuration protein SufE